ncbi:MAG: acetamidase/formamidase family protein [Candidatus Hodarchaeota archaeon]
MKIFKRELTETHAVGEVWPTFLDQVKLGESFIIETTNQECNPNGPVEVRGVKAGETVAIHIEKIELVEPFYAPNGGPFFEGMGDSVPLEYKEGYFYWPQYFRLKANPSVGNVAILPKPTEENLEICRVQLFGPFKGKKNPKGWRTVVRAPRDKHCHQDCWAVTEGAIVHMKAQVDGLGVCFDDVHAYLGQGEVAFDGIGVYAKIQARVERSTDWYVDWPVIETEQEILVFSSYTSTYVHRPKQSYVDIVRTAYWSLRDVVAAKIGGTIEEANSIVATAADIRNCALYGLGDYIQKSGKTNQPDTDIAVVACLPKDVFC